MPLIERIELGERVAGPVEGLGLRVRCRHTPRQQFQGVRVLDHAMFKLGKRGVALLDIAPLVAGPRLLAFALQLGGIDPHMFFGLALYPLRGPGPVIDPVRKPRPGEMTIDGAGPLLAPIEDRPGLAQLLFERLGFQGLSGLAQGVEFFEPGKIVVPLARLLAESVFCDVAHRAGDVGVVIALVAVPVGQVNGDIGDHSPGDEHPRGEIPDESQALAVGQLVGKGQHEFPCELGVLAL